MAIFNRLFGKSSTGQIELGHKRQEKRQLSILPKICILTHVGEQITENALNLFQRLARRWEAVHPYNAAQVMRIRGSVAPGDVADAWADGLRTMGLGSVRVLNDWQFRHESLNGEFIRYPLTVLPNDGSLEEHLSRELNRPFDKSDEPPFRPFLLPTEDGAYLGVVYQHWVADSISIRAVMREWCTRLFDPTAVRRSAVPHPRSGYWRLFGDRGSWRLDETVLSNFRSHMRHRRVRKVVSHGKGDYPVRVSLHRTPSGMINNIRSCAREHGCKVHDILLAAVAEACDRQVPAQHRANRPDMAVGSIVDLRRHAAGDLNDMFGLFLGFTEVICNPRTLKDWPRLLRSVAAQNRVHKQNGLPQASMLWMAAAMAINRLVPDHKLYHFYRKEMPTSGGLSNVNLNDCWATHYHPDPLQEYWRISPTGPLVPLVFSTTTLGSEMTIALTCREALLPCETSQRLAEGMMGRLATVAQAHRVENRHTTAV